MKALLSPREIADELFEPGCGEMYGEPDRRRVTEAIENARAEGAAHGIRAAERRNAGASADEAWGALVTALGISRELLGRKGAELLAVSGTGSAV